MKEVFLAIFMSFFSIPVFADDRKEVLLHETNDYQILHVTDQNEEYIKFIGFMMQYTTYNLNIAFQQTGVDTLYINSYGGLAMESYDLGYMLKSNDINVVVDENDSCISACAFAVSIQENITLKNEGGLLFHMPYSDSIPASMSLHQYRKTSNISLLYTMKYMLENNFSIEFIEIIIRNGDVNKFVSVESVEELNKFKVDNILGNSVGEYRVIHMR